MKRIIAVLKKWQPGKFLTAVLLGAILLFASACNSGDSLGARPQNPPVQMGGQNNPHKGGGDGYTDYQMSTDRQVKSSANRSSGKQASGYYSLNKSIADRDFESNNSRVLYPGNNPSYRPADPKIKQKFIGPPTLDPALPQTSVNSRVERSYPDSNVLKRAGETFKDASGFLTDPVKTLGDSTNLPSESVSRR
ncbi:MAG: hypothetical protein KME17_27740 [Cyanosarcina radialis HA8281-LM2]|jgi:hypothetical protein|nr:hypothetical protein [Cyanosarcina radialis HA8281-LM2]